MPDIFISENAPKPKVKESLQGHIYNPFSSFSYFPENINFETREKEEKVVLFIRRHFITNIRWIVIAILMALAPIALFAFPILSFLPANFRFIVVLAWYLIVSAYMLQNFLGWFFNVDIITDERIVDIDFSNLVYKEVSDANIDRVQDVTYKMGGVVRTMFNYGDVFVQTASEVPNFEFLAVPAPDRVAKILQDLRIEEQQEAIEGRIR